MKNYNYIINRTFPLLQTKSELVSTANLCKHLQINKASLYRLEKKQAFPNRVQITTQSIKWPTNEVNDWIKNHNSKVTCIINKILE